LLFAAGPPALDQNRIDPTAASVIEKSREDFMAFVSTKKQQ